MARRYSIEFAPSAQREFLKLPGSVRARLAARIDALAENPRPHGVKALSGIDALRLRVGDYRVVYRVEDAVLVILVLRVAHRGDVYR
ncbi:MAG: type II toxin-antitoxin system RelE/ParE family toxin [Vicinamibacteria bacterium]|nr:type II toxin-antitoxin system RelE/ParE family toxin [Vicinamibacteria bacterium]